MSLKPIVVQQTDLEALRLKLWGLCRAARPADYPPPWDSVASDIEAALAACLLPAAAEFAAAPAQDGPSLLQFALAMPKIRSVLLSVRGLAMATQGLGAPAESGAPPPGAPLPGTPLVYEEPVC